MFHLKSGDTVDYNSGPAPVEEFDAVHFVKNKSPEYTYLRYNFERNWYRNVLFYIGKQWISYDRRRRQWVKPQLPEWLPLPVTNKYAATCDAMASVLEQVKPQIIYAPSEDSPSNLATSDVCNSVIDVIEKETDMKKVEADTRMWLTLTGDAYWIPYYDNSPEHGTIFIKDLACQQCGFIAPEEKFEGNACPQCGAVGMAKEFTDPQTGQPAGKEYPKGKMVTEVASNFEIYSDLQSADIDKSPYIFQARTYPIEAIKAKWPEKAEEIKPEAPSQQLGQQYLSAISYATNSGDSELSTGQLFGGGKIISERATVWRIWVQPNPIFPKGVYAVVCGDVVLDGPMELPFHDSSGKAFVNVIHIKFKDVPGRFFGKTPADDLIHKQIQRNKLESFIQLCMQRMSNPVWLIPQSCGVTDVTGEPGEKIKYNDSNAYKSKPERVGGVEITQSAFRWLQKIDDDFEELAATYDVIKGNVPKNVPTLGGLDLLKERGMSRFGSLISNYENARVKLVKMWLDIWREYAVDYRTRSIKGENSRWIVEQFNAANIDGNVEVRAEAGSSTPRSESYQQYIAGQLLDKGLINPSDPATQIKLLQKFHAVEFAEVLDENVKDAIQEQEEFKKTNQVRLRPLIDDNNIHMIYHVKMAKTDEFMAMPEEVKNAWYQHIEATRQVITQLQMQQAMAQMPQKPISQGTEKNAGQETKQ